MPAIAPHRFAAVLPLRSAPRGPSATTEVLNPPAEKLAGQNSTRTTQLALSPDGKTLINEVDMQRMWAWDVPSRKVLWERTNEEKTRNITGCRPVFTPDSSALYYGQPRGEIAKLDPHTGKELARLTAPVELKASVTRLALSPDGKKLAAHTYYNNGELVLFDIAKDTRFGVKPSNSMKQSVLWHSLQTAARL